MSYPPAYGQPPLRRRPAAVTIAAVLMLLGAIVGVASAISLLSAIGTVVNEFRDRAPATGAPSQDIDDTVTAVRAGFIGFAVLAILLALLIVVLALLIVRGSNAARITTWVLIGISLCCGACGLLGTIGGTQGNVDIGDNASTSEALGQALQDSIPGWLTAATSGLTGLQILGYIAVAVLLALPASNAFFRKQPPAGWQPPMTPPPPGTPPGYGPTM